MNNVYFFLLIKSLLVIYVHNNNVDIHKFDLFMNENCQINDFRLRMSLNKLIRWFWWLMKMIIFSYFSFSFFWSKSTRWIYKFEFKKKNSYDLCCKNIYFHVTIIQNPIIYQFFSFVFCFQSKYHSCFFCC